METLINPFLQQVHIGLGPSGNEPVATSTAADSATYAKEHEQLISSLVRLCPQHFWPKGSHNKSCPRPILINQRHQASLASLHKALTLAITDIVQRWWSDTEANFPYRMPLAREEEELLQWIDCQVSKGKMLPFSACRGSWRPDFMTTDNLTDASNSMASGSNDESEGFCITEINARFAFNGFMHSALGQEALDGMRLNKLGLASATNSSQVSTGRLPSFHIGSYCEALA
jgi:hypothetical protein